MKSIFVSRGLLGFAIVLCLMGCSGNAAPSPADSMGTTVSQLAFAMLTGTAGAASSTPTLTPRPKSTATSLPTMTPTAGPPKPPIVINFAGCWRGPGPNYVLVSNISKGQRVELIGIGSVAGWYVIINPYFHQACWIQAADLSIHVGTDLSKLSVMTPSP